MGRGTFAGCKNCGALGDGEVLGWAALSAVSSRCVYAGVAEVSIYVAGAHEDAGWERD